MNKDARFIDFQNARNFFYQNPRTYNERVSTQIINIYYSSSTESVQNIIIDLKDSINIDSISEVRLESIQVSTMNQSTVDDTGTGGQDKGAYIPINTIGYIIDIDEFETKAASNIDAIRDKIFIPYTNYNINNVSETDTSNLGSGFSYYNNSGPLKNNYISTINPKKLKTLKLTVKRLVSASKTNSVTFDTNSSNQPTEEHLFLNEDYFGNETDPTTRSGTSGGDIMLVFSITNLPNMMINNSESVENVFMNPQDNLMNVQSEYDIMMREKKNLQNNNMNNNMNRQYLSNQQRMNSYQSKFKE